MAKSLTFIINPAARFGKTRTRVRQLVREIRRQAPGSAIKLTRHALHATSLTRDAILGGAERIIAIGGDGTLNEVVNGFFNNSGQPYNKNAILCVIPSGTGSDFARCIDQSKNLSAQISRAIYGEAQKTDVGFVRGHNAHGEEISRYFMNMASLGISGLALGFMQGVTKRFGAKTAYFMAAAKAIKAYVPAAIKVVDEKNQEFVVENCSLMSFANGKFFGSGMKIAPNAELNDGLFDVVAVSDMDLKFFLTNGYRVYQGTHLGLSNVQQTRARECNVSAVGGGPVYVETDGELFAELPARFSIRHEAILMVR